MPLFTTFNSQELTVSGDNSRRNYRGIFISIVVLTLISSLIIASIFLVNPDILKFSKLFQIKEKILLEEAIFDLLAPKQWHVLWLDPVPTIQARDDENLLDDTLLFVDQDKEIRLLSLPKQLEPLVQQNIDKRNLLTQTETIINSNTLPQSLEWQSTFQQHGPKLNFSTLVAKSSLLMSQEYSDYQLSPSRRYILASSDKTKIYRHTFIANFHIYDIEQDRFRSFGFQSSSTNNNQNFDQSSVDDLDKKNNAAPDAANGRFQYVSWVKVPNKPNQDALIIVHNNDIYYKSSIQSKETRLTLTGKPGIIYNGIPDWLYEEEILTQDNAIEISPSGSQMAYIKFNDSNVDIMRIPYYGSVEEPLPQLLSVRYPKAGRVNPTVEIYVVDFGDETLQSIQVQLPEDLRSEQHYIGSMRWLNDNKLSVTWLNRDQNISHLLICQQRLDATTIGTPWQCNKNLLIEAEYGWLNMEKMFPFNDEYYFAIMPKYESSQLGYFNHIAKISIETGNYTFVSGGQRQVTEIINVDAIKQRIYYLSTQTFKPDVRHLYWASINGTNNSLSSSDDNENCITCNIYEECQYNDIRISTTNRYYIFLCTGPGVPKYQIRSIDEISYIPATTITDVSVLQMPNATLYSSPSIGRAAAMLQSSSADGEVNVAEQHPTIVVGQEKRLDSLKEDKTLVWSIDDNVELQEKLKLKAMPQTKRLFVPIGNEGQYNASVLMLLPPKIRDDDEQNIQYPMVVNVYAGPGSQLVDQRFDLTYGHYLASSKNIIYTLIDGRGSGLQGSKMLFELYQRFGSVEIEDQIYVTRYLTEMFPFIDKHKVAIWGWSYGGYAAAMALAQGSMPSIMNSEHVTDHSSLDHNNNKMSTNYFKLPHGHPQEVFECAVSVAPVTNWLYYDSAYTERYMSSPYKNEQYDHLKAGDHLQYNGLQSSSNLKTRDDSSVMRLNIRATNTTPSSNRGQYQTIKTKNITSSLLSSDLNDRYRKASLLDFVSHMDRKRFLLVHGTADDNVHFQQSVMLMKLLTKLNILYETQLYPDEDHAINHYAAKLHLFSTINDFFGECFDIALSYDNISYDMHNQKHNQKYKAN